MPIVLGTFTSSSAKFEVDLSYHALLCVDAMKALHRFVAYTSLSKRAKYPKLCVFLTDLESDTQWGRDHRNLIEFTMSLI